MQSQNKRNTQFMIAKEIFIEHIMGQIDQDYEINPRCLGEGGFGQVFQGKKRNNLDQQNTKDLLGTSFSSFDTCSKSGSDQQNCHEPRAIKRISYTRKEDKELMQNEIEILSYLDHPLIVRLYETYEHKKDLYLILDLLKGGDLFTVINEKDKMSESQAKVVFIQIIKAISYLHAQHICHRDLKLENIIFLDKHSYNLKIIDFGLAFCWDQNMKRELRQKGLHKQTTGTPDYMSPEMLSQNYDQRCDIWSAGVILYILLSGSAPFQGQTEKQIMKKIKNIQYNFDLPEFKNVSDDAKDLIRKILKPEAERISVTEILNHPWLKEARNKSNDVMENVVTEEVSANKNSRPNHSQKHKTIKIEKQISLLRRKSSQVYDQDSQSETKCISQFSDDIIQDVRPQKLTSKKLNNYCKLSKLQKLQAIYSVSKLSELKIKKYGQEFMLIDNDNDGTLSLDDLGTYLLKSQPLLKKEEIESYFNELSLSQRDCISYSQYLACVLSYESDSISLFNTEILDFDESSVQICPSLTSDDRVTLHESINIFDDSMLLDLFSTLDKNDDSFIGKEDFIQLLQRNGIESQNHGLIEQLSAKLNKKVVSEICESKKKDEKDEWFVDPRTYKWQLSRTYKGESDGGMMIDFHQFKHLMITSSRC